MIVYAISGAINGLTVALLAVGLILVFKAGRYVNFAHAQLGMVSALVLGKLVLDVGVSWWLAFPAAVALGAGIGLASEFLVMRRLDGRSRMTLLVATVGLSQLLLALGHFGWLAPDKDALSFEGYPTPIRTRIELGDVILLGNHILILVLVPVLIAGLALFLRATRAGKAIRAAASNSEAAALSGISVHRVMALTWGLAGAMSAVSAILVAPSQGVTDIHAIGPVLLLQVLGAAAVAGFVNLPIAVFAGVSIGVLEGVVLNMTGDASDTQIAILLVILLGLFVRARVVSGAAREEEDVRPEIEELDVRIPAVISDRLIVRHARLFLGCAGVFLGLAAPYLPPFRSEGRHFILAIVLVYALAALSLTVLAGYAGQVSLGQFAFVGLGAFITARMVPQGWSLPATIVVSGGVGAVVAVAIGLPALRLRGLVLAVTTFGFAVVAPGWLFHQPWLAEPGATIAEPARLPGFARLDTQRSVYFSALVVLILAAAALGLLRRSGPGRRILAVRDNEAAATSFGLSPMGVKLSVFALAGFMASAAGALFLASFRTVTPGTFDPQLSLFLLAIPVIGGIASIPGTIAAAFLVYGMPVLLNDWMHTVFPNTLQVQLALAGGGLLLMLILNPGGIASVVRHGWQRFLLKLAAEVNDKRRGTSGREAEPALCIRDVVVSFGGIKALDHVSIDVWPGEIVGLIGANGAGKTTLLNAISGLRRPDGGSIRAFGHELVHLPPEHRAHLGVARTFQNGRLFPGLTVRETVQVALARSAPVGTMAALVGAPWVRYVERKTTTRADELLEMFGLEPWASERIDNLSTGTRRVCDLAAQVATSARVLLLDEPTAGVAQREAEAFVPVLRRVTTELGCSVLIVEHDMHVIFDLCDRLYCLDVGTVIAEGTPADIRSSPEVVASYLGTRREVTPPSNGRRVRQTRSRPLEAAGRRDR